MKNRLLATLLMLTTVPFFATAPNNTELLAHLKNVKTDALWITHECKLCIKDALTCEDIEEREAFSMIITVWNDLCNTLDPSEKKLTTIAEILFNEICQTQKVLDDISFENINTNESYVYGTIANTVNKSAVYNKTTNTDINNCLSNPQFVKNVDGDLKNCSFFWMIGNAVYRKKLLTKLVSLLDEKIEDLKVELACEEINEEIQKLKAQA